MTYLESVIDEANERLARAEIAAEEEIREAFSLIGTKPLEQIYVPIVAYDHVWKINRVKGENMAETLIDLLASGYGQDELLELLQTPQAEKLRKVLEDKYVSYNAAEVAEARV